MALVMSLSSVWGLGGCAAPTHGFKLYAGAPEDALASRPTEGDSLQVTYLGVGGYVLRHGSDVVVLAPSFSNPGIPSLVVHGLFGGLKWEPDQVKACMTRAEQLAGSTQNASLLLVGHSHYDHLMDTAEMLQSGQWFPNARILGSATTGHLLASFGLSTRFEEVTKAASRNGKPGGWIPNDAGTVRVYPIVSDHSPHFMHLKLLSAARLTEDATKKPSNPRSDWLEGETYAYVVDFLREKDGPVAFRLYYEDAASSPSVGLIPDDLTQDGHRVDVSITCVGAYEQIPSSLYPQEVLAGTHPRYVILGHWEDFFGNDCLKPPSIVRMTGRKGLSRFIRRVGEVTPESRCVLPVPLAPTMFIPEGSDAPARSGPACLPVPPVEDVVWGAPVTTSGTGN
ncbi:hypothetical protein DRW03_17345 [Corallococcus sp. H22C18031201]|nr:hypothetical protein DRW03_17345 [Corallococcus sp. H22C18031201]